MAHASRVVLEVSKVQGLSMLDYNLTCGFGEADWMMNTGNSIHLLAPR